MLGGGGGMPGLAFGPVPPHVGGGGRGSKRSAPQFPGPQGEPAHALHPRFVVAEIWADRGQFGGGGVGRGGGGGGGVPRWGGLRATHYSECRIFTSQQTTFVWHLVLLI